jgi:hypothetical protein
VWFLLFVLVASGVGIVVILVRNRRPTSMEASISEFERSLAALAPEEPSRHRTAWPRRRGGGNEWGAGGPA